MAKRNLKARITSQISRSERTKGTFAAADRSVDDPTFSIALDITEAGRPSDIDSGDQDPGTSYMFSLNSELTLTRYTKLHYCGRTV